MNPIFQRTELLVGSQCMKSIASKRVIIFGVGGVGSWCAESLVRSGIQHLTIVDSDRICITNVNRQIQATTKTVGAIKTEILKERLLEINPKAVITSIQKIYSPENSHEFELHTYDYIIDCIDSLRNKIDLIRKATRTSATFYSSMGASLKIDPFQIKTAEFWKVRGCPLGSILRKKIKKGDLPAKPFMCIYSEEVLDNKGTLDVGCGTNNCICPKSQLLHEVDDLHNHEWCSSKAVINGTSNHITAIFGFSLAGMVIQNIVHTTNNLT